MNLKLWPDVDFYQRIRFSTVFWYVRFYIIFDIKEKKFHKFPPLTFCWVVSRIVSVSLNLSALPDFSYTHRICVLFCGSVLLTPHSPPWQLAWSSGISMWLSERFFLKKNNTILSISFVIFPVFIGRTELLGAP